MNKIVKFVKQECVIYCKLVVGDMLYGYLCALQDDEGYSSDEVIRILKAFHDSKSIEEFYRYMEGVDCEM